MAKISRNAPCHCGSGKKYKKCHGSIQLNDRHQSMFKQIMLEHQAKEIQRKSQQGLGRPIISTDFNGEKIVAVKNRLIHSKTCKTFHDFLFNYIKTAIGEEWGNEELKKELDRRHPILIWHHHLCALQHKYFTESASIKEAPMNGAARAYLQLAYDLYSLDHNAELQNKLIARLKNQDNFYGARYEVFVAASMIRAGFEIQFEDESDRNTTHCEFVATNLETGRKFSVEAKCSQSKKNRIGRLLIGALRKAAKHERVIFIEINKPDTEDVAQIPAILDGALQNIRHFEGGSIDGQQLPRAYIFVTNNPWHHHLESMHINACLMGEGFNIPDFKQDATFPNLRAAINSRENHKEMHLLLRSMQEHSNPPATFDGGIPEFSLQDNDSRLIIGKKYNIPNDDGTDSIGTLTTATVIETEKVAVCALLMESGLSNIVKWPLSELEMKAWRKHPDTFFGRYIKVNKPVTDILSLYDFYFDCYKDASRESLLGFLASAVDINALNELDQHNLASIYSERLAITSWGQFESNLLSG